MIGEGGDTLSGQILAEPMSPKSQLTGSTVLENFIHPFQFTEEAMTVTSPKVFINLKVLRLSSEIIIQRMYIFFNVKGGFAFFWLKKQFFSPFLFAIVFRVSLWNDLAEFEVFS